MEVHHGFLVVVIRPAKSLGLGFAGLLCVLLWAQGELLGAGGTWV